MRSEERQRIDEVFEELVELVLRDEPPELEAFLARHPELGEPERERLRRRARVLLDAPEAGQLPFERLGDFRLVRKLGEGGMGVVYLARQESLGRLLALKLMRPELVGAEAAERRFEREARAIAQLRHPGIVTVYAAGEERGVRYLALEYLEGKSLDQLLRSEGPRLAPATVVRFGRELAEALASAHRHGVVHRDVKPSNVHIGVDGRARLLDFGLAQLADASTLAASGSFRGTPYYASPEQIEPRGRTLDARTDVYSLGATLYQALTGHPPFEGASSAEVFQAVLTREPRRPRALVPALSRDLETVLLKALEKEPARRYADAEAFARDLAALLEMRPIEARPPGMLTRAGKWTQRNRTTSVTAAFALVFALAFLGVFWRQSLRAERRFEEELASVAAARAADDPEAALRAVERALALRPQDGRVLAERAELQRLLAAARARASVARARAALAAQRADGARHAALADEAGPLRRAVTSRPMSAAESARLQALEGELAELERELEGRFAEVLEALNLARGLDPENAEAEAVLAELYLERWRAAVAARDARGERHYRALVTAHDRPGLHRDELEARVPLLLTVEPAGAEVFLFRYEEQALLVQGGEARLVPVPVDAEGTPVESARTPGTWALRVVRGAGGLEPEDLVLAVAGQPIEGTLLVAEDGAGVARFDRLLAIDGEPARDAYDARWRGEEGNRERDFVFERRAEGAGERIALRARKLSALGPVLPPRALVERGGAPITVFRRGVIEEREAPAGLEVRVTAAPLFRSPRCLLGPAPLAPRTLPPGSYLALVSAPGLESQRVPFVLTREHPLELAVALQPHGTTPPGFVYVAPGPAPLGGDPEAFAALPASESALSGYWIQEREVGVREYQEFVNDFATLEEIDAAPALVRVPRENGAALWRRLDDGTFEPPAHTLEQPVHAISWQDAEAYARWRAARAKEQGLALEFALPREVEWEKAARGADARAYPFGERFVPRWVKGHFARDQMLLEPALSFPIDEAPCGAFDLTGSLWEWCADDWDRLGDKTLRGGAWNFTFPAFFRAASRASQKAEAADGIYGFRLVAR